MGKLHIPADAVPVAAGAYDVLHLAKRGHAVAILAALNAAAPLIVATELRRLADQCDLDSREAEIRVGDHMFAGNQTGAAIATVTAEIYEAVAEYLRTRATELDLAGGAS